MGQLASFGVIMLTLLGSASGDAGAQADPPPYYFNPDWSPDGSSIVFESGLDQRLSIYTIGVDGTDLTRLTNSAFNDEGPVWSPDGAEIAFYSNRRDRRTERPISLQIYIMNADGTGLRRITNNGPALDYYISWSPDGNQLVFQSRPELQLHVYSLFTIGTDGMGRRRITDGQYNDFAPQWSPDGKLILFSRSLPVYKFGRDRTPEDRELERTSSEIMLLNIEDGTQTPVTQNAFRDFDPSWNADGSEVYFFQDDGQRKTLYRQPLGETEADAVAVADGDVVSHRRLPYRTRLSPNGRFLVYHKDVDGVYGIYIYDLEREVETLLVGGQSREGRESIASRVTYPE